MSSQLAFSKLNKSKGKGKNKIRRIKTIRRRKISPRKRPGSPLSNEIKIEEFEVDTSPKERKTPIKQKSLKDLAIEIANSKESQPSGCFGNFCKKVSSKFTRRGGKRKRKRKRTRKRRSKSRKGRRGVRGSPPRRR